jgi:tripartite motif-containing protein 71
MRKHGALASACFFASLIGPLTVGVRTWRAAQQARPGARPVGELSLSYIGAWGTKGSAPGKMDEPTCIATDVLGNAYLADAGSHYVEKFDSKGTPLLYFEDDNLKTPQSIAVDAGGAIYVADAEHASTYIYFPNGDHYRTLKLRVHSSSEDTLSLGVANDGTIHILDGNASSVFTYTGRMRFVRQWQPEAGAPDTHVRPSGIAVGEDGSLYVADRAENRILKFTPEGRFVSTVASHASGASRRLSDQFTVYKNYIFAMDVDGRGLHAWSTGGQPLLDLDLAPELGEPARSIPALAVSPHGELLVLDTPAARVLRYRINF